MEMAQEEAVELALAVRKQVRKNDSKTFFDMAGEIADVEIMIEQIKFMHESQGLSEQVEIIKDTKLARLANRISENTFES